jgi:hypothetical protein
MDRTFRTSNTSFIRAVAIGSLLIIGLDAANRVEPAFASSPALQDGNDADQTRLVGDFLHYVLIAKPDLAEAAGRQLFESGITDAQLAELVSENDLGDKVDRSLSRGRGMAGVGPMVTEFEKRLEEGRLELARNQDRIQEAIGMLNGSLRAQMMGKRRLIEAGEYAVPQLLDVLVASKDPEVEIRVIEVIEEIKRQAVLPLCAALPELSATVQTKVCRMLSKIGWPTAMPYLLKVATSRQSTPEVKDAAMTAFRRLGGTSTDVSAAFTALGRKFFAQEQSLIAYPADPVNMVWNYGPHSGLVQTPVPTSIFCQVMAMRSARTALAADPSNRMALAVFVAADLRRENQIGAGETDPFAADAKYTPQFFATAAGSSIARDVLAMAIDGSDTALVRDAISALGMTVERGRMVGAGGRQPLLECLRYPDRRVQYDAALVLGAAMPEKAFAGDNQVVPLLANAIRSNNDSFAVVVASTDEDRNSLSAMLGNAGFTVVASGPGFYDLESEINRSNGIDLVVVHAGEADAVTTVGQIRNFAGTGATPVMLMCSGIDKIAMDREFTSDRATGAFISGGTEAQFQSAVNSLMEVASGGRLTANDSMAYTRNALQTLANIARHGKGPYDITAAEPSLLAAMTSISGGMRLLVAEVVSLIATDVSQQALIDAALAASSNEQISLLDLAASSARSFGNKAAGRQVEALRRLIASSTGEGNSSTANAAGRLYGSLDLSSDEAIRLIAND